MRGRSRLLVAAAAAVAVRLLGSASLSFLSAPTGQTAVPQTRRAIFALPAVIAASVLSQEVYADQGGIWDGEYSDMKFKDAYRSIDCEGGGCSIFGSDCSNFDQCPSSTKMGLAVGKTIEMAVPDPKNKKRMNNLKGKWDKTIGEQGGIKWEDGNIWKKKFGRDVGNFDD